MGSHLLQNKEDMTLVGCGRKCILPVQSILFNMCKAFNPCSSGGHEQGLPTPNNHRSLKLELLHIWETKNEMAINKR